MGNGDSGGDPLLEPLPELLCFCDPPPKLFFFFEPLPELLFFFDPPPELLFVRVNQERAQPKTVIKAQDQMKPQPHQPSSILSVLSPCGAEEIITVSPELSHNNNSFAPLLLSCAG